MDYDYADDDPTYELPPITTGEKVAMILLVILLLSSNWIVETLMSLFFRPV